MAMAHNQHSNALSTWAKSKGVNSKIDKGPSNNHDFDRK